MTRAFSVSYDKSEQRGAFHLFLRRRFIWKGALRTVLIVGAICAAITFSKPLASGEAHISSGLASVGVGLAFGVLALAAQAILFRITVPMSISRSFRQLKLDGKSTDYRMSDDQIEIVDPVMAGSFLWSDLVGWTEDPRYILICRSDNLFYSLPKAQIDPEIVTWVRGKLESESIRRF